MLQVWQVPWCPLCASAQERRADSSSLRYGLPRPGEGDIEGVGVEWQSLRALD